MSRNHNLTLHQQYLVIQFANLPGDFRSWGHALSWSKKYHRQAFR